MYGGGCLFCSWCKKICIVGVGLWWDFFKLWLNYKYIVYFKNVYFIKWYSKYFFKKFVNVIKRLVVNVF